METFFKNELDGSGNLCFCPNPPDMADKQIIVFSLPADVMGIDDKNCFLNKLRSYCSDYLPMIYINIYNKR